MRKFNLIEYPPSLGPGEVSCPERAIVYPLRRKHLLGGVEFEETGEYRAPRRGDWYYDDVVELIYHSRSMTGLSPYQIVRPVRVV